MVNRSKLTALETALTARIASRGTPSQILTEDVLTPDELRFVREHEGKPLSEWTLEDRDKILRIYAKYSPPETFGGHGTGQLPNCGCAYCIQYQIYAAHQNGTLYQPHHGVDLDLLPGCTCINCRTARMIKELHAEQ